MIGLFAVLAGSALVYGTLVLARAKVASLHLLAVWMFFIFLPAIVAFMNGNAELAARVSSSWYLYAAYTLGVVAISFAFSDQSLISRFRARLEEETFRPAYLTLFVGLLAADIILRIQYRFLVSGTLNTENLLEMPYFVSALWFMITALSTGLFCYACLYSARSRFALGVAIFYIAYALLTDGRRALFLCIFAFVLLRARSITIELNRRTVILGAAAILAFFLLTPIFMQARINIQSLQFLYGVDPVSAFMEGTGQALSSVGNGSSGFFGATADNLSERGNAGIFFVEVVDGVRFFQWGALTWESIQWVIPSAIAEKPPLPVEQVLQLLIGAPLFDDAVSAPAVLYADFGAFGVFFAGVLAGLYLYGIAWFIARRGLDGPIPIFLLGTFFTLSFRIEQEPTAFLVILRDMLILSVLALPFSFFRNISLGAKPPQAGIKPN